MKKKVAKFKSRRIMFVMGTRPEVVKLAPVIKKVAQDRIHFRSDVVVTAQHREMLDQTMRSFNIKSDFDLNIMRPDQSLAELSSFMLKELSIVMREVHPDLVVVQGDTTTTFIASLVAFYLKIPLAHVEAGLRTSDKWQPFPEEMNRRLVTVVADLHFAPTRKARANLLAEGVMEGKVYVVGNTGVDALIDITAGGCQDMSQELGDLYNDPARLLLVTVHRRENHGLPLVRICRALKEIAKREPSVNVLFPVHLNPNIRNTVGRVVGKVDNIHLVPPLDYRLFSFFMKKAHVLLTDSGGIQEEGPMLGKPVLVLRDVTERDEAVRVGAARLVGTETKQIVGETLTLLHNSEEYAKMAVKRLPFGDGKASARIVSVIRNLDFNYV